MIRSRLRARGAAGWLAVSALALSLAACGDSAMEDNAALEEAGEAPAAAMEDGALDGGPEGEAAAAPSPERAFAAVDAARLENAQGEPGQWMSHGRTYAEQRFSPLDRVTTDNVGELGLDWYADLTTDRGQEATPIMVDGVLYVSEAWSKVNAYDAVTGEQLWHYDPQVDGEWAINACCDVVNRGVAVWDGKVYVGTIDGRLIALDAETGEELWDVLTVDLDWPYTITGAPRVVKGNVLIGNGGAEYGVRGYVTAYDAETGEQNWRFYTVPGEPGQPDGAASDQALADIAEQTWAGEWWTLGGGGTVWDSMSYDPELDLLYIGVGNGAPWNHKVRSNGEGDNLFLSSIVALDPDTGEYVWHYQSSNADTWDHTATQQMILADLEIDGQTRQVIMQAPKNGFFYVLDRATGELISAEPFTEISWATHVDMETGRPVENPAARFYETGEPFVSQQNPNGAHTWHSMSYSPETDLVYFPIHGSPFVFADGSEGFQPHELTTNQAVDFSQNAILDAAETLESTFGRLIAWDPVAQQEVWRVERAGPANGGALATAGGVVFQGTGSGLFTALDAQSGETLWETGVQTGVIAAPISYEIDGEQYVAVVAGTGGSWAMIGGDANMKGMERANRSRLLVYRLGGTEELPPAEDLVQPPMNPPEQFADADTINQGAGLYGLFCGNCHGGQVVQLGILPDLRRSVRLGSQAAFDSVVLDGALAANGMTSFDAELDPADSEAIRAYIIARANEDAAAMAEVVNTDR